MLLAILYQRTHFALLLALEDAQQQGVMLPFNDTFRITINSSVSQAELLRSVVRDSLQPQPPLIFFGVYINASVHIGGLLSNCRQIF